MLDFAWADVPLATRLYYVFNAGMSPSCASCRALLLRGPRRAYSAVLFVTLTAANIVLQVTPVAASARS